MSLSEKVKVRPYICGVFLCFNASFTASTSFQNFYDTDILEADVVSLYATSSKVKFTETKTSTRAGYQYKQNISISLPIADELRSEHITRIHQAEQVVLKLTNGEYLFLGRNDARQNTKPKISYFGDEDVSRFQFENLSISASGYTDIDSIGEIPDDFLFVLLENGKTIRYLGSTPGDTGLAFGDDSGIVYTALSTIMFQSLDPETDNYTNKCTTLVTDMSNAFSGSSSFNQNISHFDTSNVTSMSQMFAGCNSFNQDLSNWDVSSVTQMIRMFRFCYSFDSDLSNWNVSNVSNMQAMFEQCDSFNSNINNWNVSNVTNMQGMFKGANIFNRNISAWNVSNVVTMFQMFLGATSFNQPLNNWNVSSVTNMTQMFNSATSFNQPLNNWDVSSVITMSTMFTNAINFNQPLNNWNVSSVTNMYRMFEGCRYFNQPLNNWDVSNVTNMQRMFKGQTGVFIMNFNQDLTSWCVSQILTEPTNFAESTFLMANRPNWGAPC